MTDTMTQRDYWNEVENIASSMLEEALADHDNDLEAAEEDIQDTRLHETIDGHQWVIYYAYNLDVIKHSDNSEYMVDNFGGEMVEHLVKEGGTDGLHTGMAFWALYADVQDKLSTLIEDKRTELEERAEA